MSKRYLGGDIYFEQKVTSQEFSKDSEGGGGSSTLSGLTDVDISNPTDGQTLVYNANSGKWENGAGGGGAAYFVDCSYALDEHDNPKLTSSKTTAEIRAAIESGALVYIRFVEPGDTSEGVPDMTHVYSLSGMSVGTLEGVTMASFGVVILYSGHSDEMCTEYTEMADYPVFASPR